MSDSTDIIEVDREPLSESQSMVVQTTSQMLQVMVDATKDPAIDAGKLREMFELQKDMLALQSKQEWNRAYAGLRKALPAIRATRGIPDNSGKMKFYYADRDDHMAVLRPYLEAYGFTLSYWCTQSPDGKMTTAHLDIIHESGHSEHREFTVRNGNGPPKSSSAQASGSDGEHAVRYALEKAFDLTVVGKRPDNGDAGAAQLGEPISFEESVSIYERVEALNFPADKKHKFLTWAGVVPSVPDTEHPPGSDYERINTGRLQAIKDWLAKRESEK